jgi:hypothetical protein
LLYERLLKVDFSQPSTANCAFVDMIGLAGNGPASSTQTTVIAQVQVSSKFNPLKSAKYRQKALEGNVPDIPPFQHLHRVFKPGAKLKRNKKSSFRETELSLVPGSRKSRLPSQTQLVDKNLEEKKDDSKSKNADVIDILSFLGDSSAQTRSKSKDFFGSGIGATNPVSVLSQETLDFGENALMPPATSNPASSAFLSSHPTHKPSEPDEWDDFDEAFKKTNIGSNATDFFRTPIAPQRSVVNSLPIMPSSYIEHKMQETPSSSFFSALNVPLQPVLNSKNFQPVVDRSRPLAYSSSNHFQSDFFTQLQPFHHGVNRICIPAASAQDIKPPVKLRRPNDPFADLN